MIRLRNFALLALLGSLVAVSAAAQTVFSEDFADNSAGWTLGTEWQIGSATASTGHTVGNGDPATDHTPTADNGVAGVVIGGNATTTIHGYYYLTSPVINTTSLAAVELVYWRWLNSDYAPFMANQIQVFDGATWQTIFQTGTSPGVQDSSWTEFTYDISAYSNANLQIRWGHNVNSGGAFTMSSWNIDDVEVRSPPDPVIEVLDPGNGATTNGGTENVGALAIGSPTTQTFTINNLGATQNLSVSSIAAAPTGVANCSVNATPTLTPAGAIAPSGSATFDLNITPTAAGPFEATVTITSNDDAGNGTYVVIVQGTGVDPAIVVSVTGPTAATVPLPQTDLVVTTFDATANAGGNVTITGVTITKTGTVNDTDITDVKLWVDVNSNGTLETGTDNQIGGTQTLSGGTASFTGLSELVTASSTVDFLVTYSLSATASGTFGADVTTVTATPNNVTGTPATGPTHTAQQPELTISSTGPAAGAVTVPQTDRVVATFDASASVGGDQTITDVTVTQSGSVADTDVTEVKLWVDVNSNGTLETGTDTQLGSTQTFTAGATTFASLAEVVTASTTTDFLITYTLAATATGTFGADVTTVTVNTGTVTGTPATGAVHTILVAVSTLPFIDDFESGNPGNRSTQVTGNFPNWNGTVIGTSTYATTGTVTFGPVGASGVTPFSGTNQAGIDFGPSSADKAGAIDYFFDLSAFNAASDPVNLSFYYAEDGEEQQNEDGVFISLDGGATWVVFVNRLGNGTGTHTQRVIDISALLTAATLNFTNNMVIRFQGMDNFPFGSDGHVFDDIELYVEPEINVSRNSTSIPHRGSVDVGNINVAGGSATFDIENLNNGSSLGLTDSAPDYMVLTPGGNLDAVSVTSAPTTPIAGGSSSSFTILIDPTGNGAFDFTISIGNSDTSPTQFASGTDGVLTAGTSNFASATANFVAADVGTQIVISGSGSGNDGTYTITAVNSATDVTLGTAPTADEGTLAWSHEGTEDPYTITVTGTGVTNGSAQADPATGSSFAGTTNGPLSQAVAPGATLANADIELTDPESDNITVTAITPPGTVPTGIVAPSIPGAGHPITLSWTGTADASNPPGDYTWTVTFSDAVNGTVVNCDVTITINDVAPTHTILNALSGDGLSAGTAYAASFTENDTGATSVDLATVSDANTSQTVTLGTVNEGGGNPSAGAFQFVLAAGTLTVAPAGTLAAADVGTHTFDMNVTDGTNPVTIFVTITVFGNSGSITFDQTTLPAGTVGSAYTTTLTVTGATAPNTFSVIAGSLPAGLSLNGATGEISGTPTVAATSNFTIRVVDSGNDSAQQAFSITINTSGGGGGGGGGGDDGGCSTGTNGFNWLALLGLLGVAALAFRMRSSKA